MYNQETLNHAAEIRTKWIAAAKVEYLPIYRDKFMDETEIDPADANNLCMLWAIDYAVSKGKDVGDVAKELVDEIMRGHCLDSRDSILSDESIKFFKWLESEKAACLPEFKNGKLVDWLNDLRDRLTEESTTVGGPIYQKILENERIAASV